MTIVPRDLESQLSYFDDKVGQVDPAGQKKGGSPFARARLERLWNKRWELVWESRIANEVAPVLAIVRDDGSYVVTFDDWHSVGHGPHVVVIYGPKGERIRALSLADLVPPDYIKALPHSVSSIRWRGEPRFSSDGHRVIVPMIVPGEDFASAPKTIDVAIDLADGRVSPINRAAWQAALEKGNAVLARKSAAEEADKAAFLAPLTGPRVNAQPEWHDYLREAVGRLAGDDVTASTTVLRAPGARDYAVSETWVREALTDGYADNVALASLSESNLVSVLERIAATTPKQSLSNVTVFVATSDRYWPAILAAMKPTGAKLIQLDPGTPIPQRVERIARRYDP